MATAVATTPRVDTLSLRRALSPHVEILTDPHSDAFQHRMKRWSEINRQTPAAIVLPHTEKDCQDIAGGMSPYSTIGIDGVIVDLSGFGGVVHDRTTRTAVLSGGVLAKTVGLELAKDGFCTTLPAANTVGAIPFFLNGGNSILVSQVGFASDLIVSARVVMADGGLLNVDHRQHADLLYALRGAGQFFGLVTQLTIRTFPVAEVLKNPKGDFWAATFIFPVERVQEVGEAVNSIIADGRYRTSGLVMVTAPPPAHRPTLIVAAQLIAANASELQTLAFQPLHNLQPMKTIGSEVRIENSADALDAYCSMGDYKRIVLTGLKDLTTNALAAMIDIYAEMTTKSPSATRSIFALLWNSGFPKRPDVESAVCLHETRLWLNTQTWCTEAAEDPYVKSCLDRVIEACRADQQSESYVDFTNSMREGPIERRYRGQDRLERLRGVKVKWDPSGRLSRQFL